MQAGRKDFCRGGKIEHDAVFTHEAAVFLGKHHAAPGGDDGRGSGDFPEDGAFPFAETVPAFAGYDVRYCFSCRFTQMDVGIHIIAAELRASAPPKVVLPAARAPMR